VPGNQLAHLQKKLAAPRSAAMKKLRWFLLLGEMAIFFAGCATIPMASTDLDAAAKTFTPPAGQANLYIVRSGFFGGAIAFHVIVDRYAVGSIGPGTFHLVTVEPGHHSIQVSSNENSAQAKFDAEADKNYFFEVSAVLGMMTARVAIDQIDEEKGKKEVTEGKRAESLTE
jgi:hypothetical protein